MNINIRKMVLTSLFIALSVVLPQIFHMFELGNVISPMHFTVLICGLLLGGYYGFACGVITPFLANLIFTRPPLFPVGLSMAIELGIYGFVSGILFTKLKLFKNDKTNLFFSLLVAMIIGRAAATLVNAILFTYGASKNNFGAYLNILFIVGLPGIILQILIIPPIVMVVQNHFGKE